MFCTYKLDSQTKNNEYGKTILFDNLKKYVKFIFLRTKPSNVLILDEPTSFIDIQTIEALEGFIENVAEQIWRFEERKLVLISGEMF